MNKKIEQLNKQLAVGSLSPENHALQIEQLLASEAHSTRVVKTLSNGLRKVEYLDAKGNVIAEVTMPPEGDESGQN